VNISSHDLNSINQSTNFLLTFLIVVAALILYGWSYFKMQNAKEHFEYAENRFLKKNEKPLENDNEYSEEDFLKSIEKSNKVFKKLYLFNMILLPAVLIGFVVGNIGTALTSKYINESIT
ncbi:hypothetical protein, partial [Acinetobacter baumannii]|uniref:hypothetical protein n=1 Tax=Acinetobacter baumannii TaxID=470 RepID=UPI0024B6A309